MDVELSTCSQVYVFQHHDLPIPEFGWLVGVFGWLRPGLFLVCTPPPFYTPSSRLRRQILASRKLPLINASLTVRGRHQFDPRTVESSMSQALPVLMFSSLRIMFGLQSADGLVGSKDGRGFGFREGGVDGDELGLVPSVHVPFSRSSISTQSFHRVPTLHTTTLTGAVS